MGANSKQIGGGHYKQNGEQHWDRIWRLYGRGYFVGCSTAYIERYHLKNGKEDLEKAIHFLQKLIELEYPEIEDHLCARTNQPTHVYLAGDDTADATPAYVNQDR